MPRPLLISSQSDHLIRVFNRNSHIYWQTVQIQVSWLLQKPPDLDLHCLLRQGMTCSAREGLITKTVTKHSKGLNDDLKPWRKITTYEVKWNCSMFRISTSIVKNTVRSYSWPSLSRPRLSRIIAYLEVKIWSLPKHENLITGNKILWKRGEIATKEQFLLISTIFLIYL